MSVLNYTLLETIVGDDYGVDIPQVMIDERFEKKKAFSLTCQIFNNTQQYVDVN